MQSTNWAPEHSEALREYLARGMSYSELGDAINEKSRPAYSRKAAIGRATRMGLGGPDRRKDWPKPPLSAKAPLLRKLRERFAPEFMRPMPIFERAETVKLRCVEIDPRHLSMVALQRGDCRYAYGGDDEARATTVCGHPRREGSSY